MDNDSVLTNYVYEQADHTIESPRYVPGSENSARSR